MLRPDRRCASALATSADSSCSERAARQLQERITADGKTGSRADGIGPLEEQGGSPGSDGDSAEQAAAHRRQARYGTFFVSCFSRKVISLPMNNHRMREPARVADQPVKQHGSRNDEEIGTHCLQTTDAKQSLHIQILFEMRGQLVERIVLDRRLPFGQPFFRLTRLRKALRKESLPNRPCR